MKWRRRFEEKQGLKLREGRKEGENCKQRNHMTLQLLTEFDKNKKTTGANTRGDIKMRRGRERIQERREERE